MYKQVSVEGKGGIRATIILDSVSSVTGERVTTFELVYHRNIHSELMTHRMFSRNAASSRAIPFAKMQEQCTAMPIFYGKNQSGMQAKEELDEDKKQASKGVIEGMRHAVLSGVEALVNLGNHKQTYNRYLEPFQMMKTIVTATSFDNWFWLRKDSAADPLIEELARCMYVVYTTSSPQVLNAGEWHLPYVLAKRDEDDKLMHGEYQLVVHKPKESLSVSEHVFVPYSVEDALKVSAARCAAVSFRNSDYGLEKSREVWERLVGDERKHSSACEHQAKVMQESEEKWSDDLGLPLYINYQCDPDSWEKGISHITRDGKFYSGNLCGFVQLRKLIDGECCHEYKEQ